MLLPTTDGAILLVLLTCALLWGIWANTLRVDSKVRFEFYAFDFAIGMVVIALLLAWTLGNAGSSNTFTFEDNLTVAGKRNMMIIVGAGAILALGQLLMLAGVALAGMSTAIPVAMGMAMTVTVVMQLFGKGPAHPGMVYGAAGVALLGVIVAAMAQSAAAAAKPVKKGMHPAWKGFILSCVGGVILGLYPPVVDSGRAGDIGVGSYGAVVFLSVGCLLMTPLVNLYFLNLPVQGNALSLLGYFKTTVKQHVMGAAGGAIWGAGAVAFYAAAGVTGPMAPKMLQIQGAGYGSALVAALCGLLVWGEQKASGKAKGLLFATALLLGAGAALLYLGA